jgi:hypothetical protein
VDTLTTFGVVAVTAMMVCYALETRHAAFVLAFAGSCVATSVYGFMAGTWPFGVVEAVWAVVALRRWQHRRLNLAGARGSAPRLLPLARDGWSPAP